MKMMEAKNEMDGFDYASYFDRLNRLSQMTQEMIDLINEKYGFHVHMTQAPIDLREPFGAILWHRRTNMNFPLCVAAELCKIDIMDMIKMELGWAMPQENFDEIMMHLMSIYGITPSIWFKIRQKGREYQKEKPMDLSYYLGIDLPAYYNAYRPAKIYGEQNGPLSYVRHSIDVVAQRFSNGKALPKQIIWKDGRVFPIDKIDVAQESARLETGGIGTRFSCWFKGQQRNICYETQGQWFVESPVFA